MSLSSLKRIFSRKIARKANIFATRAVLRSQKRGIFSKTQRIFSSRFYRAAEQWRNYQIIGRRGITTSLYNNRITFAPKTTKVASYSNLYTINKYNFAAFDPMNEKFAKLYNEFREEFDFYVVPVSNTMHDALVKFAPKAQNVIDLGCGNGDVIGELSRRFKDTKNTDFLGVDKSPNMLALAKSFNKDCKNVSYENFDAVKLNGNEKYKEKFDFAIANFYFSWSTDLKNLQEMMAAAAYVLKPGGTLAGIALTNPDNDCLVYNKKISPCEGYSVEYSCDEEECQDETKITVTVSAEHKNKEHLTVTFVNNFYKIDTFQKTAKESDFEDFVVFDPSYDWLKKNRVEQFKWLREAHNAGTFFYMTKN